METVIEGLDRQKKEQANTVKLGDDLYGHCLNDSGLK